MLMTAAQASAYLGMGRDAVRRLTNEGHIPVWIDPDTGWRRYSRPALDKWLEQNCRGAA